MCLKHCGQLFSFLLTFQLFLMLMRHTSVFWLGKLRLGVSLVAQSEQNLPATQEMWVQFLGREDPLEEGMATHSSVLAWRILWTEEPGRLQSVGLQELDTT